MSTKKDSYEPTKVENVIAGFMAALMLTPIVYFIVGAIRFAVEVVRW